MKNFSNKICFVTGGANGIGKAIVKAFHQEGATVLFCDRDSKSGETIAKNNENIYFYPVDIKDEKILTDTIQTI